MPFSSKKNHNFLEKTKIKKPDTVHFFSNQTRTNHDPTNLRNPCTAQISPATILRILRTPEPSYARRNHPTPNHPEHATNLRCISTMHAMKPCYARCTAQKSESRSTCRAKLHRPKIQTTNHETPATQLAPPKN